MVERSIYVGDSKLPMIDFKYNDAYTVTLFPLLIFTRGFFEMICSIRLPQILPCQSTFIVGWKKLVSTPNHC